MRNYQEIINLLERAKDTIKYLKNLLELKETTIKNLKLHIQELNDQIEALRR